jgi:hypothetical protein
MATTTGPTAAVILLCSRDDGIITVTISLSRYMVTFIGRTPMSTTEHCFDGSSELITNYPCWTMSYPVQSS